MNRDEADRLAREYETEVDKRICDLCESMDESWEDALAHDPDEGEEDEEGPPMEE